MNDDDVFEVQRLYPQIYLACHTDHVRAASTKWRISSQDALAGKSAATFSSAVQTGLTLPFLPEHLLQSIPLVPVCAQRRLFPDGAFNLFEYSKKLYSVKTQRLMICLS